MRVLLTSLLLIGCHRDLDVPECAKSAAGCTDAAADEGTVADSQSMDSGVDSGSIDSAIDTADACECSPGTVEPVTGSCPGALEKKTRTCATSCKWEETCALPKGWTAIADAPIEGRIFPSLVWTGGEAIVFGGTTGLEGTRTNFADGALYSLRKNTWETLAAGPLAGRVNHSAVWAGTEMLVLGGESTTGPLDDGAAWDGYKKTWSSLPKGPLAARAGHGAVWTGSEMIVWGGADSTKSFADGARYSGSWSLLPPAPISARASHVMLWTGTRVVIWGGRDASGTSLTDGAFFDPTTSTWTVIPAPGIAGRLLPAVATTGTHMFVFGGVGEAPPNNGATLSLSGTPAWTPIASPATSVLEAVGGGVAWATGDVLTIWSGATMAALSRKGAVYDRAAGTWSPLDVTGAPDARMYAVATWAGSTHNCALVWGGVGMPGGGLAERLTDGAIYVP